MGSKRALLPWIWASLADLPFDSVLDAFSGSGCVAHFFKRQGKRVITNDLLEFSWHTARATVENSCRRLTAAEIARLTTPHPAAGTFIRDTFGALYFPLDETAFLDHAWAHINELPDEYGRSLALAALCRACVKRRPRGLFTYTGHRYDDGRRDLRLSLAEQFAEAATAFNAAIFDNDRAHRAYHGDIFDLDAGPVDLVYLDPPYLSPRSDNEYHRRYHFLEGLVSGWSRAPIDYRTKTRKTRRQPSAFDRPATALAAFGRLFERFRDSILVLSYASGGVPAQAELARLMAEVKREVRVVERRHTYHVGSQRAGNANNRVTEYLLIGT
jgi:DNA adenine methylase